MITVWHSSPDAAEDMREALLARGWQCVEITVDGPLDNLVFILEAVR